MSRATTTSATLRSAFASSVAFTSPPSPCWSTAPHALEPVSSVTFPARAIASAATCSDLTRALASTTTLPYATNISSAITTPTALS